jgi:hypothetical protein
MNMDYLNRAWGTAKRAGLLSGLWLGLTLSLGSLSSAVMAEKTPAMPATETTIETIHQKLVEADRYRSRYDSGELFSEIRLYRQERLVESNRYRVQFRANGDSRVLMLDTRSKGQKVLLLSDAMWLYVPRTRKPVRITPMQRLMGQASYGDVASLRWSQEYRWDEQPIERDQVTAPSILTGDGFTESESRLNSVKIGLAAQRRTATYRRIDLWLEEKTNRPVKAEFFLASGKLMKTAYFHLGKYQGAPAILITRFLSPGREDEYTLMESSDIREISHSDRIFTRQGMAR